FAETVQRELEAFEGGAHDIDSLREAEEAARIRLERTAQELSRQRAASATVLARQVEQAIRDLNMGNAAFEVAFDTTPDPEGIRDATGSRVAVDATGYDRITFMLA